MGTSTPREFNKQTQAWCNVEFRAIAAGGYHTCGIRESNGKTECWGDNEQKQCEPAGDDFRVISSGAYHTCGLRESPSDNVVCWGDNRHGQTSSDTIPTVRLSIIAAGDQHNCALRFNDSHVECWGRTKINNETAGASVPEKYAEMEFTHITSGRYHSCALKKSDDTPVCWGYDKDAQVSKTPTEMQFSDISAGASHTCGLLKSDSTVFCWGLDDNMQVSGAPGGGSFSMITSGGSHTCAKTTDSGEEISKSALAGVICWGNDYSGQLATGAASRMQVYSFATLIIMCLSVVLIQTIG